MKFGDRTTLKSYQDAATKWNINVGVYQAKLNQMSGYDVGAQLLTDVDDMNLEIPTSIHYKFKRIDENLGLLRNCYNPVVSCQKILRQLDNLTEPLKEQTTRLFSKLNEGISEKYNKLRLSPTNYFKEGI